MNLANKVALVAGGARIGAVVAEDLARHGCHLVLAYNRSKKSAFETAAAVRSFGRQALVLKADLTKEKGVKKLMAAVKETFGVLNVLVNMVSIYEKTPWAKLSEKSWEKNIDANLKSAYLIVLHGAPLMKKGGRIVHFSDWVAASGRPRYKDYAPYYAAKTGIIGLTQVQALELAPSILVNAVAPGPILPPVNSDRRLIEEVTLATPLKRWGGAQEISKTVIFLTQTDFVTGECVRVDGGRHLN